MLHLCFSPGTGALPGAESPQLQHPATALAPADHDVGKTEGVSRCPGEGHGEGAAAAKAGTPGGLRGNRRRMTSSCPEAAASTFQTPWHRLLQDCILNLNQFLPRPIIFIPENFPVVFPVKKTQAAWTRSWTLTFSPRCTLSSVPHRVFYTVSQTACSLPLSALTRAWHKYSAGSEMTPGSSSDSSTLSGSLDYSYSPAQLPTYAPENYNSLPFLDTRNCGYPSEDYSSHPLPWPSQHSCFSSATASVCCCASCEAERLDTLGASEYFPCPSTDCVDFAPSAATTSDFYKREANCDICYS
ncbi:POU class 2 homeobox associating factor 3 isoform X2 [Nycticebus coucang]|uniref:POU class 2 homeobox associating factor 3 isoform X2 n=1 Tax=Nycticebus coucang TaxID=9470 RepID=UPI00234DA6A6|nr:POU class 2 homeobox associating factor 3 isoform X2 [Nycticebus coucang]